MRALPIDEILDDVVSSLSESPSLVLEAPPGAGKTTRVPAALLDAGFLSAPEILVLQPRRLAARMAARFVAAEAGEEPGGRVGYQVRFDEKVGPATRLKFITEALLLRRLLDDRRLERVGAVIFDEFHERHLATDVALAMMQRLRQSTRPDLRLVVMSATLDAAPIAEYLDCPALRSEGRRFPVAIEYARGPDDRPLERQVASAVARLVGEEQDGDVLVFLPGAREIHRAAEACEPLARERDLIVAPLFGDLSPEEQDRAVRPADRRKVILSTNVAETSVTIDGVVGVVDSGLARIAGHDPWSGMPTLKVRPISRASAAQRAGRAGRVRPGRCLRLYTEQDHDARREQELPEIRRLDLSNSVLLLSALGVDDPAALGWLEPPPEAALTAARDLLVRLGATDGLGRITEDGRRMAALPLHPRQARIVLEAQRRGRLKDGATIAAVLGERELRVERRAARQVGSSDLLLLAGALDEAERSRFDARRSQATALRPGRARAAVRARDQIVRVARRAEQEPAQEQDGDEALLVAVLAGYPDRVARRRPAGGRRRGDAELLLALGGTALLADSSVVRGDEWLIAVEAEQRDHASGRPLVTLASAVDPTWLLDLFADRVEETDALVWNRDAERVERVSRLTYEALVLDESRVTNVPAEEAASLLREQALAAGPAAFADARALRLLRARIATVHNAGLEAGLPALDDGVVREALAAMCEGRRSFAELREASLLDLLRSRLGASARRLDELAPPEVALPGGRRLRIQYELDKPPWAESWLQDFFGMRRGPTVAGGRVPLTLHLLAPNRRAVQVTTDLAGFWEKHYPALRRSLSRRYPRHAWPEDPLTAKPPPPSGRRRRR